MKFLGYSVLTKQEIEHLIKEKAELVKYNESLKRELSVVENELRICKTLLDASQNSVIQLSRHR